MQKNGCLKIGDTEMYYVSFGSGSKKLVVLPGLSDGLATVKGKTWILSFPHKKFFQEYTVYIFSRKNKMPDGYTIRDMARDQVIAVKQLGIEQCVVNIDVFGDYNSGINFWYSDWNNVPEIISFTQLLK